MKFKDKYNISNEFEGFFSFKNEKEELKHEAYMIMFRFLSELEKVLAKGDTLKKKELADKLGVSSSFITQLFNGNKLMNLTMLAKIQEVFNITFDIKARSNDSLYSNNNLPIESLFSISPEPDGFWVWRKLKKPDYALNMDYSGSDSQNIDNSKVNAA
jgi:transcriptional regulator with XRE-family HTH domain